MHFTPFLLRKKNCLFLNLRPPLCHIVVLSTSLSSRSTSLFICCLSFAFNLFLSPICPLSLVIFLSFVLSHYFFPLFHSLPFDLSFSLSLFAYTLAYTYTHIYVYMYFFSHKYAHTHIRVYHVYTYTYIYNICVYIPFLQNFCYLVKVRWTKMEIVGIPTFIKGLLMILKYWYLGTSFLG